MHDPVGIGGGEFARDPRAGMRAVSTVRLFRRGDWSRAGTFATVPALQEKPS